MAPANGVVQYCPGSGTYYSARGSQPVQAGDVICLFPGVPHAYGPHEDERWDEINIDFAGPAFDAWRGEGMLDPAIPVRHLEPIGYWLSRFNELVGSVSRAHGMPTLRDTGKLLEQTSDPCRAIARRLGFESEFYFSRRFKQLIGVSPREYRQHSAAIALGKVHSERDAS